MNTEIFLVDTSIWIHVFRQSTQQKTKQVQDFFRLLSPAVKLTTTGIVLAECICGLGKGKKDEVVRKILERYDYLPSTKDIYVLAGELSKDLENKGLKTPLADCLIAATAISYGVTLISKDLHFKRFKELKLKFLE